MDIRIEPSVLSGEIRAIASKSYAHRALICAALSDAETLLHMAESSKDIDATTACLEALGTVIAREGGSLRVTPASARPVHASLDCGESGSTLRFLLPVAAALCDSADFSGSGRLPERPLSPLIEQLREHGATFSSERIPLRVTGISGGGRFKLPGDVSSQYISGLLLAAPLLNGVEVDITSKLESAAYVDITVEVMREFGVEVKREASCFSVRGGQNYRSPGEVHVQGDWSNAAFWLAAGLLSGGVTCTGLDSESTQGDRRLVDIIKEMGAALDSVADGLRARPSILRAAEIDASDIPDLVPVLAVLASAAQGETHIKGAARLRLKESDRLKSVSAMINALGGKAAELEDGLIIAGVPQLKGGVVDSFGDHRIAMAAAVAACVCNGAVTVKGAEAADKSYPGFWRDYERLGGVIHVV